MIGILGVIGRTDHIRVFELSEVLKAPSNSSLRPKAKSKAKYYNSYEKNFLILPDEKTLVGRGKSGCLQFEVVPGKEAVVEIDQGEAHTMVFNPSLNSLLVGYGTRRVSQFEKDSSGVLKKQMDYKHIGVGWVQASDCSGDIAVVGGSEGKITFIHMRRREVLQRGVQTALANIESLQFCRVSQTEMHLVVSGFDLDYSNSKTDLFDVSELFPLPKTDNIVEHLESKLTQQIKKHDLLNQQIHKLTTELQNEKQSKNRVLQENMQLRKTIQLANMVKQKAKRDAISQIATSNLDKLKLQTPKLNQQLQKMQENPKPQESIPMLEHTNHIHESPKYAQSFK